MRGFTKLVIACILMAPQVSIQLILLMVFNIVYIIYTLCFMPSKSKLTNILNTTIHSFMILFEIVLFVYNISDKSSAYQITISYVLLSLMGTLIVFILAWVVYRLVMFIRVQFCGYVPPVEEPEPVKGSRGTKASKLDDYEKVNPISSHKIGYSKHDEKEKQWKDKDMNVSELNFKDEEEQMSDAPSINVEEAMQQFTYHYVPKKTEAMIKHENAVLGIKEEKKNTGPIVIEIDEDELLESTNRPLESRPDSRMKRTKRIKDSSKEKRGNLRIDPDDNFSDLIPAD